MSKKELVDSSPGKDKGSALDSSSLLPPEMLISPDEITDKVIVATGSYGVVYRGVWQGQVVAVKQFTAFTAGENAQEFLQEAKIVWQMGAESDYTMPLKKVCLKPPNHYWLRMEFMAQGSLQGLLKKEQDLPWSIRYRIALDIAYGLRDLHARGILHRDLKSLNVLLTPALRAKLIDFGLAKLKDKTLTQSGSFLPKGSIPWMAPELLQPKRAKWTMAADIYSLGMVLWELVARKMPFLDSNPFILPDAIGKGLQETLPPDCPLSFKTLIESCVKAEWPLFWAAAEACETVLCSPHSTYAQQRQAMGDWIGQAHDQPVNLASLIKYGLHLPRYQPPQCVEIVVQVFHRLLNPGTPLPLWIRQLAYYGWERLNQPMADPKTKEPRSRLRSDYALNLKKNIERWQAAQEAAEQALKTQVEQLQASFADEKQLSQTAWAEQVHDHIPALRDKTDPLSGVSHSRALYALVKPTVDAWPDEKQVAFYEAASAAHDRCVRKTTDYPWQGGSIRYAFTAWRIAYRVKLESAPLKETELMQRLLAHLTHLSAELSPVAEEKKESKISTQTPWRALAARFQEKGGDHGQSSWFTQVAEWLNVQLPPPPCGFKPFVLVTAAGHYRLGIELTDGFYCHHPFFSHWAECLQLCVGLFSEYACELDVSAVSHFSRERPHDVLPDAIGTHRELVQPPALLPTHWRYHTTPLIRLDGKGGRALDLHGALTHLDEKTHLRPHARAMNRQWQYHLHALTTATPEDTAPVAQLQWPEAKSARYLSAALTRRLFYTEGEKTGQLASATRSATPGQRDVWRLTTQNLFKVR